MCSKYICFHLLTANCPPGTYQTTRVDTQLLADGSQNSIVVPQCTECPVGYYLPDQGQTNCEMCPPGSTSTTPGSTNCLCAPHHYSNTGYIPCTPCPQGTYSLTDGSTACINCNMSSSNVPISICPGPVISTTSKYIMYMYATDYFVLLGQFTTTALSPSLSIAISKFS